MPAAFTYEFIDVVEEYRDNGDIDDIDYADIAYYVPDVGGERFNILHIGSILFIKSYTNILYHIPRRISNIF